MTNEQEFDQKGRKEVEAMASHARLNHVTRDWISLAQVNNYSYHFRWLGRPIIQYPQDIVAMQELIWRVQPDLIIETGVARGGSLIFSASMLALLDASAARPAGNSQVATALKRRVVGIDIDIRPHNRAAIESHPLSEYVTLIQGSSTAYDVIDQVAAITRNAHTVLVCLDSNHTHEHVLSELQAYAPMTTVGSYCVVFDTIVEDLPPEAIGNRPWSRGNSPKTAVHEYLQSHPEFEIDKHIDHKLLISVAPDGYLRRICE